jgi:hypothetical protein
MSGLAPVNEVPKDPGNVTNLLIQWSSGDHSALQRLTPIIYDELLRLARARLHRESGESPSNPLPWFTSRICAWRIRPNCSARTAGISTLCQPTS